MSPRLARLVAVALVLLSTAACVRMPEDGPVVETRSDAEAVVDSPIYIDPLPPRPGDSPTEIVRGFLDAMTATPIETTVARKFLTPDAAAAWTPERATLVYGDVSTPQGGAIVSVTLDDAHRLDARGAWRGPLPRGQDTLDFPMVFTDAGQWRIAEAPDALVVPETWFAQRFRQVSLYFFDPTARILVPEPVFVPRGEQQATTLTTALLRGPGPGMSRVSRSFIPPGLSLGLSVPVSDDGVADLALKGDAGQQTSQSIGLMLAQFAWTLRQEPSIRALRVSVGGRPLQLPGGASEVSVGEGSSYDPTGVRSRSVLTGLQGGRLVTGTPGPFSHVDGRLGSTDYGLTSVAVNLTAEVAAGVSGDGRSVLRAQVQGTHPVRQVLSGATDLLRPAWDAADRLWVVDRGGGAARVLHVEGSRPVPLTVPGVTGRDVKDFLVSRDGSRLVAVVRGAGGSDGLVVSRLRFSRGGRVVGAGAARPVIAPGTESLRIRDIAWAGATSVAVLSTLTDDLSQVRTVSVDGSPPGFDGLSTTLRGRVDGLAGSPMGSESLYAVTRTGLLDLSNAYRDSVPLGRGVSGVEYPG